MVKSWIIALYITLLACFSKAYDVSIASGECHWEYSVVGLCIDWKGNSSSKFDVRSSGIDMYVCNNYNSRKTVDLSSCGSKPTCWLTSKIFGCELYYL